MSYIYALKLQNDCYYVGKTNNPDLRVNQHIDGIGAAWTSLHPPIDILYVKLSLSPLDEDLHVKELMIKYGILYVRGGSYSQLQLSDAQLDLLVKEICSAKNLCFICASNSHFAADCPNIKKIKKLKKMEYDGTVICSRCNRKGHTKSHCITKTKANGKEIKVSHCSYCNSTKHNKSKCMVLKLNTL